ECTGDEPPAPGTCLLAARLQLFEEALDSVLLDVEERLTIDSCGASVPSHADPCLPEDVTPPDVVIQGMEPSTRCPLGCGPELPLQLSHFVERPTAAGVVRSGLAGHSLALTCSVSVTTARTLPSRRVVRHGVRARGRDLVLWYYDPLGLPLGSGRLRLRLIRRALPRRGPPRRVSRVPHFSLHTCCAPYPAGIHHTLRISCAGCCLHREMSGSAPELFLCRGCRLHFMLRPACLLPAARLSPPNELSTPRSGARISPGRLGSATRRSDAYRGGTLTRWRSAACRRDRRRTSAFFLGSVTTHHGRHASKLSARHPANFAPSADRKSVV